MECRSKAECLILMELRSGMLKFKKAAPSQWL